MTYKEQIEFDALNEAIALSKMGNKQKDKRVQLQIGSYSKDKFDRIFVVDKLHKKK